MQATGLTWQILHRVHRELGHAPVVSWQLDGSTPLFIERYLYRQKQSAVSALPLSVLVVQFGGGAVEEGLPKGPIIKRIPTQAMLVPKGVQTNWRYSGSLDFGVFYLLGDGSSPLDAVAQERGAVLPFSDDLVSAAAWQLINGAEDDPVYMAQMADVMLGRAWRKLANLAPPELNPSHTHLLRLQEVLNHIRENPASDLSVQNLAQLAGVSAPHFFRLFQQSTGVSPHRFVLSTRLDLARTLLAQSRYPISHIAEQCGFSSTSHLTCLFGKAFAMTPARYRRVRFEIESAGSKREAGRSFSNK